MIASLEGRTVWLTAFWDFNPETWGLLGFTQEDRRSYFIEHSRPGDLVVIFATKQSPIADEDQRGKILGVLETTHETGEVRQFCEPAAYERKMRDPRQRGKWNYAVRVSRAWRIPPDHQQLVDDFASDSYSLGRAQVIGDRGTPLSADEIKKLGDIEMYEVPVYGQRRLARSVLSRFADLYAPSRAVPAPMSPYTVEEVDGPRHLYILALDGDLSAFLGADPKEVAGKKLVKVGLSKSPAARCAQIQAAYPQCAFRWRVLYSTMEEGREPYPNFEIARHGEDRMKIILSGDSHADEEGRSLGGEFFLADDALVDSAWVWGKAAARNAILAETTSGDAADGSAFEGVGHAPYS